VKRFPVESGGIWRWEEALKVGRNVGRLEGKQWAGNEPM